MARQNDNDRLIAALADQQHGVVGRAQLIERGVPEHVIDDRVKARRLVVLRKGTYALGHCQLRRQAHWLAAVLACGDGAVLSHRSAAAHWGLLPSVPNQVHVAVPTRSGRRGGRSIVAHRVELGVDERTVHDGIPITSVARTILDLAADLEGRRLEQAIRAAARARRFDLTTQRHVLSRHPRHRGAKALGELLDRLHGRGTEDLRSELEIMFLELCDAHGFPPPVVNGHVEGIRVDFHWAHASLVVETDGFDFHAMPTTFEQDRANDQRLILAGWRVIRATHRQTRRGEIARVVLQLLRQR